MKGLFEQLAPVQAGETIGPFTLSYDNQKRSAGWALTVLFFGETGLDAEVTCADGSGSDDFTLTVPASVTKLWRGGRHSFQVEATNNSIVNIVEQGVITVLFNPRIQTPEMKILAAIRAMIASYTGDGQRTISVDGMSFSYSNMAEMQAAESRYLGIVNGQIGQAGGKGGRYKIQHRTPQDNRYGQPVFATYAPGAR